MSGDDAESERLFRPHDSAEHGERLWTPWRMPYVGGGSKEDGCVFCNRLAADDDASSLILWRGERSFIIMNLFPYNTGHVMLVPNEHVASPETADPAALAETTAILPGTLRALRRALGCDGFNVGLNVGAVAGAGIAAHLHQHVVPRWTGDANFMPILASTMVLPELIPVTYAKLRAEIERELGESDAIRVVLLAADASRYAVLTDGSLPMVEGEPGRPIWRSAVARATESGSAELLGWAGPDRASAERGTVAVRGGATAPIGLRWREVAAATDPSVASAVRMAREAS